MNRKLKLTQRIYVGYNGMIGPYLFKDGISVEEIPEIERVRIAANFGVVELDEDGNSLGNPSPAHTLMQNYRTRLSLREPLARQSEEEKSEENVRAVVGKEVIKTAHTREALEAEASESGIAGLRRIAADWNVRSKSIPALIELILDAQSQYAASQREALKKRGVPQEEIDNLLKPVDMPADGQKPEKVKEETPSKETPAQQTVPAKSMVIQSGSISAKKAVANAAATGDLSAAISTASAAEPE